MKRLKRNLILDIIDKYHQSPKLDHLWESFHEDLSQYGVTSVFYGWTHSLRLVEEVGPEQAMWHKNSHSKAYNEYFGSEYYINNDLSSLHCIENTNPFVWHDRQQWGQPTQQQEKFMMDSYDFNMGVGVTLPIRFNQSGFGGLGLNFADSQEKEFEKVWDEFESEISTISYVFDELARGNHMDEVYPLTSREVEVLTWLTLGKTVKMIAHKIGSSPSTVEKQVRSARQKLGARNNEQAVTKALLLGLINP